MIRLDVLEGQLPHRPDSRHDRARSINRLASLLGLDATTVTRQVGTMEGTKLVVRRSDPDDGRISLISLSPQGRRKMRAVQLARNERIARLLEDWTEDDRRQLGRLLARFNDEVRHDTVQRSLR